MKKVLFASLLTLTSLSAVCADSLTLESYLKSTISQSVKRTIFKMAHPFYTQKMPLQELCENVGQIQGSFNALFVLEIVIKKSNSPTIQSINGSGILKFKACQTANLTAQDIYNYDDKAVVDQLQALQAQIANL